MDTPATMGMDTLHLHWEAKDNLPFVLKGKTQLFPFLVVQPDPDPATEMVMEENSGPVKGSLLYTSRGRAKSLARRA